MLEQLKKLVYIIILSNIPCTKNADCAQAVETELSYRTVQLNN